MDAVTEAVLNPVQPHIRALCTLPEILVRIKVSKSAVYVWMANNKFPRPCLVLGPRYTRWSVQEIDSWLADQAALTAANAKGAAA
jgi:predicted DNA-binding transcriptional regulator AlpA